MRVDRAIVLLFTVLMLLLQTGTIKAEGKIIGTNFSGVWSMIRCEPNQPKYECATFYLYLTQRGNRICGEHFVATSGLGRLDEGDPGTVLGVAKEKSMILTIRSGRNGASYMAEGQVAGRKLIWQRVGMVVAGGDDEPPIIPEKAALSKDITPKLLTHLKEIDAAPCRWPGEDQL
jgi:hypothetical protein